MISCELEQTNDTLSAGRQLALSCPTTHCIIFLKGPLGVGKTTLARGFLEGLGFKGTVKSPTYTLVEPYNIKGTILFHFDLYRLKDPEELEVIGIRDYTLQPAIWLVEWPEKASYADGTCLLPAPDLIGNLSLCSSNAADTTTFSRDSDKRQLDLTPHTDIAYQIIQVFKQGNSFS